MDKRFASFRDDHCTHKLVLSELAEINDGDGTFRGINLGSIEGDELFQMNQ